MIALLLVAAISAGPSMRDCVVGEVHADVVEDNWYYDADGHFVFRQVIWWEWDAETDGHRVVAWRLVRDTPPSRDMLLVEDGIILRVRATAYLRTWTQYDPELQDRQCRPRCRQPGLWPVPTAAELKRMRGD